MGTFGGYLIVFLGAGLGGALRHAINRVALVRGSTIPWHTFVVNVTGSLAIGLLAGWFAFRGESSQTLRLFLTTGILGGYTTFSAFSLDAALLWERGQVLNAALYVGGVVTLSILSVFLGLAAMRAQSPMP
jgi:CrcB protein